MHSYAAPCTDVLIVAPAEAEPDALRRSLLDSEPCGGKLVHLIRSFVEGPSWHKSLTEGAPNADMKEMPALVRDLDEQRAPRSDAAVAEPEVAPEPEVVLPEPAPVRTFGHRRSRSGVAKA